MEETMNFTFDGNISREVLENYLSRSVTAAGLYESKTLEDDLRAIREMGVKFLGRASGIWYMTMDDEEHFRLSKELADKVHAQDPEVVIRSCWMHIPMESISVENCCLTIMRCHLPVCRFWKCREKNWYWCVRVTAKAEKIQTDGPQKPCRI